MYSSFYTYGNVFKSYQVLEKDFLENIDDYVKQSKFSDDELSKLYNYYASYFSMDDVSTENQIILPRKVYLQKFMELSPRINRVPFYIAFSFGFLGALIFSLTDSVKRFNELDLYPKTYLFYSIRFVVSASLAVTLAYVVVKDWPILMGPLVFFLIGYFPERAIKYLDEKMTKFLGIKEKKYEPIPLSKVQGLSDEKALRLREVGIQDVQNLALADIDYLRKNTPFTAAMLADWIAQSILVLYFPDNIDSLRHHGVRTILDFKECMLSVADENRDGCAALIGVKTVHLLHIDQILRHDHMKKRLVQLQIALGKYSISDLGVSEAEMERATA
jgi:hypothetical protein